jgi:molybdenum cofactor cytidylyltransferase
MAIHVLIVAAGAGKRLGLGPKAHVTLGEETFLSRVVRSCREAALEAIRVVGSVHDPHIVSACERLGVSFTANEAPERGMSSSVYAGLKATLSDDSHDGVLVFPVDVPLVRGETVRLLARALSETTDIWARPVFRGENGHPVGLGSALVPRLLTMTEPAPLRDALRALGARAVDIACDDAGVVADIDLPEHLEAARRRFEV